MKRLTLRLDNLVAKRLMKYKILFKLKGKKVSYNSLINAFIFHNANNLHITQNDINKIKSIHTSEYYKFAMVYLAHLTNSLNHFIRQIKGANNNLNQISKSLHKLTNNLSDKQFIALNNKIDYYRMTIQKCLKYCKKLDKEVSELWQM